MEQFCTNLNEKLNSEEIKNKKRFHKAINLIDDFVTKFISKIEYYKMTLESQINNAKLTLINTPLSSDIKTNEKKEDILYIILISPLFKILNIILKHYN
jgi:hypothetical protein